MLVEHELVQEALKRSAFHKRHGTGKGSWIFSTEGKPLIPVRRQLFRPEAALRVSGVIVMYDAGLNTSVVLDLTGNSTGIEPQRLLDNNATFVVPRPKGSTRPVDHGAARTSLPRLMSRGTHIGLNGYGRASVGH
jgi:hypothetical protein